MSELFDAKSAARTVEEVGHGLLHGQSRLAYDGLLQRMGELNPPQVKELSDQLFRDNLKPNGMPSVDVSVGADGHISGFTFKPALSDIRETVSPFIMIGTGHRDSGVAPPDLTPSHGHHKPLVQGG